MCDIKSVIWDKTRGFIDCEGYMGFLDYFRSKVANKKRYSKFLQSVTAENFAEAVEMLNDKMEQDDYDAVRYMFDVCRRALEINDVAVYNMLLTNQYVADKNNF